MNDTDPQDSTKQDQLDTLRKLVKDVQIAMMTTFTPLRAQARTASSTASAGKATIARFTSPGMSSTDE